MNRAQARLDGQPKPARRLVHAAGMVVRGKGILLPGISGTGKSTFVRQFHGRPDTLALSDDRIILRKIGNHFWIFGTPWLGTAEIACNDFAPLHGIYFLSQGAANFIERLDRPDATRALMPMVSVPWFDNTAMQNCLKTCDKVVRAMPAYRFTFTPDERAAETLYNSIA